MRTRVVNPPIYRASTILFPSVQDLRERYKRKFESITYGRDGTQTYRALARPSRRSRGCDKAVVVPYRIGSSAAAVTTALLAGTQPRRIIS